MTEEERSALLLTIFHARKRITHSAESYYCRYFRNANRKDVVNELLDKTEKTFLEKQDSIEITVDQNLDAYLFGIFKNHVRNYFKKKKENELIESIVTISDNSFGAKEIEGRILKKEILKRMSLEDKYIFEMRLFGYSFTEIESEFNETFPNKKVTPGGLRVKYHRTIRKLAEDILR